MLTCEKSPQSRSWDVRLRIPEPVPPRGAVIVAYGQIDCDGAKYPEPVANEDNTVREFVRNGIDCTTLYAECETVEGAVLMARFNSETGRWGEWIS